MASSVKESDAQVTFEDQEKINKFARTNTRLMDLKEELTAKEKEFQNITDAEDELLMLDSDSDKVPYHIGEVLVEMSVEEAQTQLESAKEECQKNIDELKRRSEGFKQILSDLKTALYAKFGSNINLDVEEES